MLDTITHTIISICFPIYAEFHPGT